MTTAPIALFTYARPTHTARTLEALLRNDLAAESDLVVFSDAARSPQQEPQVEQVRTLLAGVRGFRSVKVVARPHNLGLSRSIIGGVGDVLQDHERVIVLEDDMVTSSHFLRYMNEALDRFAGDDRVISIHGYVYPVQRPLPEAFFLRGADCWGWATWRRGWKHFDADGQALLDQLTRNKLLRAFDFNGSHPYSDMLRRQIAGKNDSWAIRWYASAFLASKLTLYPGRSLVHNIGNDGSGTHAGDTAIHDTALAAAPIDLRAVPVEPSADAQAAFEAYFRRSSGGLLRRALRKVHSAVAGVAQ